MNIYDANYFLKKYGNIKKSTVLLVSKNLTAFCTNIMSFAYNLAI